MNIMTTRKRLLSNKIKGVLLGTFGLSALSIGSAHADLLEYSFTDTNGEVRTLTPSNKYANPVGPIKFALNAGVDRKVRISITDKDGKELSSATSGVLGAGDRISVDGREYYGAYLELPEAPEGEVNLVSQILSSTDDIVKTDIQPLSVDRSKPYIGELSQQNNVTSKGNWDTSGELWLGSLSGSNLNSLSNTISAVASDNSGIANVSVEVYDMSGNIVGKVSDAKYNSLTGLAGYAGIDKDLFPIDEIQVYKMVWRAIDVAGNTSEIEQSVALQSAFEVDIYPWAVSSPDSSELMAGLEGYVPYQKGMTVHSNPVVALWRVPRELWAPYNPYGLGVISNGGVKVAEDEDYLYIRQEGPVPLNGRVTSFGSWGYAFSGDTHREIDVTLLPGTPVSPSRPTIQYHYSDIGWAHGVRLIKSESLPVTIDRIRYSVSPRDYDQIIRDSKGRSCIVKAGESDCYIEDTLHMEVGTAGYFHMCCSEQRADNYYANIIVKESGWGGARSSHPDIPSLRSEPAYSEGFWNDFYVPVLLEHDIAEGKLTALIELPANRAFQGKVDFGKVQLQSGDIVLNGSVIQSNRSDALRTYEFDLTKLPEGEHELVLFASNNTGSERQFDLGFYGLDQSPPVVELFGQSGRLDQSSIGSLADITVKITDSRDESPRIVSINIAGGPANDNINLPPRKEGDVFKIEYPIMFPSLSEGEGYTLTVVAEDAQGNQATETASFTYNPPLVSVAGHPDGNINIPAVSYAFNRNDGTAVMVSEPLGLAGGQTLAGVYDLLVTLSSDTVNPINANGVIVQPGETATVMAHDFSAHGGRISLAVSPVGNSIEEGISRVLVSTTAPNAPMVQATLHQWMPDVAISLNSQTPVQAITDTTISAAIRGDQCALTTSVDAAKAGDPILAPVCLLEWDSLPKGFSAKEVAGSELAMTNLVGRPLTTGVNTVGYSIYLFNKGSEKVLITQQEHSFDVRPASEAIKLELVPGDDDVYQGIQDLTYVIRSSSGTLACDITGNETIAINAGKQWSDRPTCLVRWTRIPYGMSDDGSRHNPQLRGYMTHLGEEIIGWKASLFTPAGEEVVIYDVSSPLNVLAPPPIEVDLPDQPNRLNENTYAVSSQGGFVGNTTIRAVASDIKIRAMLDTQIVRNDEVMGYGQALQIQNPINANAATLWSVTPYTLETSYTRMANLATKTDISLLAVPADSIQPVLMYSEYDAIDTEEYQVSVRISDVYQRNEAYSITKHGDWDIRLLQSMDDGSLEPITDWEPVNGEGVMTAAVDISDMTNQQMIIYAEARVRSPVPEYSSIRRSTGSLSLFVLSGSPLDAEISTVKLQGLAPLRASFIAKTVEHWANRSMGDVTWEISSDNGATWEEQEPGRLPQRLSHVFQAGNYLVRAHIQNRHSGAMSVTPTVEVSAFEVPKARMSGPTNVFVGDEGVYTITDPEGEPFNPDGYVIEWTEDRGNTWQQGGPVYSLTRETPERIQLQARIRYETAPEHRQAYRNVRSAVSFRDIRPPRVQIIGPRRSEVGVEATWTANLRLPYPGMSHEIQGFFTLPDGQRVDAHEVLYTPTQEDFAREKSTLLFESWIDGYQDKGAHSITEYRLTFWSYDWPDWQFNVRANAIYAPADITVNLRNLGLFKRFEELKVEWDLPQSDALEVTRDNSDMSRSFTISEPGVYTVAAHVSDARGHYSFVEVDIELLEPEAWGVDLTWTGDNQYNRAPLKVLVRPTYYGGHPRDRINSKQYVINGEVVSESGDYGRAVLGAGTHEVIMNLGTMMGRTVQGRTQVTVEKNRPPVCEISVQEGRTNWRADASCSDEDGRMSTYKWWVNGELQSISSRAISIAQWRYPEGEPIITLVGVDDSGDESAPVSQK